MEASFIWIVLITIKQKSRKSSKNCRFDGFCLCVFLEVQDRLCVIGLDAKPKVLPMIKNSPMKSSFLLNFGSTGFYYFTYCCRTGRGSGYFWFCLGEESSDVGTLWSAIAGPP